MAHSITRIVLVGVKHAGKSSVGRALAQHIELPFIDGDEHIIHLARSSNLLTKDVHSARDLYRSMGHAAFHRLEQDSLKSLPHEYVYAAGGGLAECPDAWAMLGDAYIILLDVPVELAWRRIVEAAEEGGTMPAFLQDKQDPFAHFSALYQRRRAVYAAAAHSICNCRTKDARDIAKHIADTIKL